ncbi:unnamed protein product [Adineta steineri]|uniref:Uncharacterized protein n=1 Tax=Adineta steineri TaxID=433720 RepID=A0A818TSQ9_9BILA|nr:unnamed protein product [Adineta steineri]CAF0926216.1 unnamed protein product [Adineta steineri]CAF3690914.1 unnamed protein product [Adineta steineri]
MSNLNPQSLPVITKSSEQIRQKVDERHWELFETRLKKPLFERNKENYTKSNDYHIIDRLKPVDQTRPPIQPNQRWQSFCTQLTDKTNESTRLMSIFHNVWVKNWNTKQLQTDSDTHENTFLKHFKANEHDKKVISSILHQNT